jgi:hypothetical protein
VANGAPVVLSGQLIKFRAPGIRALDHRFLRSGEIYERSRDLNAREARRHRHAEPDEDRVVESLVRVRRLTADFRIRDYSEIEFRNSDIPTVTACDLALDIFNKKNAHTAHCMLLGNCDDNEIARYLDTTPEAAGVFHDAFYDVRSRLRNQLAIADLVFAPAFSQGGLDAESVEKMTAWMFGAAGFTSFKLCQNDEGLDVVRGSFLSTLRKNQELCAALRRRMGFESIEMISGHLDEMVRIAAKAKKAEDVGDDVKALHRGLAKITESSKGLQIADETAMPAPRVEAVQISMRL